MKEENDYKGKHNDGADLTVTPPREEELGMAGNAQPTGASASDSRSKASQSTAGSKAATVRMSDGKQSEAYASGQKDAGATSANPKAKASAAQADGAQQGEGGEQGHEEKTFKEAIREQAREDEVPFSRNLSLKKILGGDILNTSFIRRQIWVLVLIVFFIIIYIANRYSCQQDIIEIDKLQSELRDAKYKALSSNSQITERSRQSNVLEMLKNNKDSVLKIASQPPYIIEVPEEDAN
jgi:hypothetical protein